MLALYPDATIAAKAAERLHGLDVSRDRISIVARDHAEERNLAEQMDATPGVELEDSRPAAMLGELSGHVLAAIALVMPGIGPVVAAGPLAAELGEVTGHAAGSLASVLTSAGLPLERADALQREIANGAILVGVHTTTPQLELVFGCLSDVGASRLELVQWK